MENTIIPSDVSFRCTGFEDSEKNLGFIGTACEFDLYNPVTTSKDILVRKNNDNPYDEKSHQSDECHYAVGFSS